MDRPDQQTEDSELKVNGHGIEGETNSIVLNVKRAQITVEHVTSSAKKNAIETVKVIHIKQVTVLGSRMSIHRSGSSDLIIEFNDSEVCKEMRECVWQLHQFVHGSADHQDIADASADREPQIWWSVDQSQGFSIPVYRVYKDTSSHFLLASTEASDDEGSDDGNHESQEEENCDDTEKKIPLLGQFARAFIASDALDGKGNPIVVKYFEHQHVKKKFGVDTQYAISRILEGENLNEWDLDSEYQKLEQEKLDFGSQYASPSKWEKKKDQNIPTVESSGLSLLLIWSH